MNTEDDPVNGEDPNPKEKTFNHIGSNREVIDGRDVLNHNEGFRGAHKWKLRALATRLEAQDPRPLDWEI
jgi:hypothetical protein